MNPPLSDTTSPRGPWQRALRLADRAPASRNRYVDFLRALSILTVVLGHWLMAAPHFDGGRAAFSHLLDFAPWSRWLTWFFQVMPVFFFIGGYANGASWRAAQREGNGYGRWLYARVRRLIGPVLPLLLAWGLMASLAHLVGVEPALITVGSQVALVPIWFLAVYIFVVALVPVSEAAWTRWGWSSVAALAVAAALVDLAFFGAKQRSFGWLNFLFVWTAVHQLGYAWRDEQLTARAVQLLMFIAGGVLLVLLTHLGPYPLSLVGVPSEEISNTLPPKLPLLALATAQIGLLLLVESVVRRWLQNRIRWALTVLLNGMIMTIFLWHSSVMLLLIGLAYWQLPGTLESIPGNSAWWLSRPLWFAAYTLGGLPVLFLFVRFESIQSTAELASPPVWRQLLGCAIVCMGLALLALHGVAGDGWLGLRWLPLLLAFAGALLAGVLPLPDLSNRAPVDTTRR